MWFVLSLIALFVGYCWYDSMRSSFYEGAGVASVGVDRDALSDDEVLDESTRFDYSQQHHDMGFMTPDRAL